MAKAKPAKKSEAETTKKFVLSKKSFAQSERRRRARARARSGKPRSNPAAMVANPPMAADLMQVLLPGFGAYAATRVIARVVFSLVQKRFPKLGKHAHALAGAAAFGGTWFFAHKIKRLAKYHDGIVMGSGVAALHGIASCYLPTKYAWLLADCRPEDVKSPIKTVALPAASSPAPTSGGDEYSYLESQLDAMEGSGSNRPRTVAAPKPSARPVANALKMATGDGDDGLDLDPDLADALEPGEDVDDLYSGAFEN